MMVKELRAAAGFKLQPRSNEEENPVMRTDLNLSVDSCKQRWQRSFSVGTRATTTAFLLTIIKIYVILLVLYTFNKLHFIIYTLSALTLSAG